VQIGNEMVKDTMLPFADLFKDATYTPMGSLVPRGFEDLPPMLLGADFLLAHRVLVSHSQRKVYFTYAGGPVFRRTETLNPPADLPPPADSKP
jgi:hypothetical protein